MQTEDIILQYLAEGKTQSEVAGLLKLNGIKPNSLSYIEKKLKAIRKQHNAKTIFHLAVILSK